MRWQGGRRAFRTEEGNALRPTTRQKVASGRGGEPGAREQQGEKQSVRRLECEGVGSRRTKCSQRVTVERRERSQKRKRSVVS